MTEKVQLKIEKCTQCGTSFIPHTLTLAETNGILANDKEGRFKGKGIAGIFGESSDKTVCDKWCERKKKNRKKVA